MKTLIIYAHPDVKGHCSVFLDVTLKELKERKMDYKLVDLYKLKYDPVLKADELYSSGKTKISKENLAFQKDIAEADKLIFIYPLWWNNMPAILKGFFDRVFVPKFAFEFIKGIPNGLLNGKKAAVFITSGASTLVSFLFMGNRGKKAITKDVLGYCGIKTKVFQFGSARHLNDKTIERINANVVDGLNWLYD
ncbi:NAD(P)H-dependent oxidoreductase [Candidatus Woesearchaeota archaeon]|nr:NAD(P)H-dependent oxidoreductase [Candidatus Woesearchaeota archaeon]